MKILVTGSAGFIGMHLSLKLSELGHHVYGIDNLNDYYDINLKKSRLKVLKVKNFVFKKLDIFKKKELLKLFSNIKFDLVVHLAAQAGVRYSIENPDKYVETNINGFLNILDACYITSVKHIIYASSSSVYGNNKKIPFIESDNTDKQISFYGVTKKSNELMAHCYSHLHQMSITGLRFFTVYGPWGRPDMAPFLFAKSLISGSPIKLFNNGEMLRDFTYIDDIIEALIRLILKLPSTSKDNINLHNIYNIGNSEGVNLKRFVSALELNFRRKAIVDFAPIQKGDMKRTLSDSSKLEKFIDFKPNTSIEDGIYKFVKWYKDFYKIDL